MSNEWTTVSRTKKSEKNGSRMSKSTGARRKPVQVSTNKSNLNMQLEAAEFNRSEFDLTVADLKETSFYSHLKDLLTSIGLFDCLIGLGIGSITTSMSSRLQLALLCILGEIVLDRSDGGAQSEIQIFDPIMSNQDMSICADLGISVLSDNVKGKHDNSGAKTLYFMPHCPYRLYCNILWSNWNHLSATYILGNSFTSYSLRRISSENAIELTDSVLRLLPYLKEMEVWSNGYSKEAKNKPRLSSMENSFCDLSLMNLPAEMSAAQREQFDKVLCSRASEETIDQSSLDDEELF